MKKLSLLFAMLMMVVSGAWADAVTTATAGYYRIQNVSESSKYLAVGEGGLVAEAYDATSINQIFKLEATGDNQWYIKTSDGKKVAKQTTSGIQVTVTEDGDPYYWYVIEGYSYFDGLSSTRQAWPTSSAIMYNEGNITAYGAWNGFTRWNAYAVEDVDMYSVTIASGLTVTYNSTTLTDGGFFMVTKGTTLTADDFNVSGCSEGYTKSISVKNGVVTITTILTPEVGKYYRFKNNEKGTYLTCDGSNYSLTSDRSEDNIFYWNSDSKLVHYKSGKFVSATMVSSPLSFPLTAVDKDALSVSFCNSLLGTAGCVDIQVGEGSWGSSGSSNKYIYNNLTLGHATAAGKWAGYDWIVEPVIVESRTTVANAYGTICLPYDATATGAVVMEFTGRSNNGLVFTPVENTTLSAGVPYLYRATTGAQTFTTTGTTYTVAAPVKNFTGSYTEVDLSKTADNTTENYFLYTTDNKFHPAGSYVHMSAYKCYFPTLPSEESIQARSNACVFGIFGDEATGIQSINTSVDLNKEGKFVNNGRVVIVKNGKKFNVAGQAVK